MAHGRQEDQAQQRRLKCAHRLLESFRRHVNEFVFTFRATNYGLRPPWGKFPGMPVGGNKRRALGREPEEPVSCEYFTLSLFLLLPLGYFETHTHGLPMAAMPCPHRRRVRAQPPPPSRKELEAKLAKCEEELIKVCARVMGAQSGSRPEAPASAFWLTLRKKTRVSRVSCRSA